MSVSFYRENLRKFRDAVQSFRSGSLEEEPFKQIRLPLGVHYHRPETSWMLRVPFRGSRLTVDQARYLARVADRYEKKIHFTTRQSAQLSGLPLNFIPEFLYELYDRGIITYGASGNGIRSVKLSATNGLPESCPNLYPLLWKIEEYCLGHPMNMTLPGKFKITIASRYRSRDLNLRGEDLGIQHVPGGEREHFRVYAGGGLGPCPRKACDLDRKFHRRDLPVVVEAAIQYFYENGNRQNRNRARLKFLLKQKGKDTFRREILSRYESLKNNEETSLRENFFGARSIPHRYIKKPGGLEDIPVPETDLSLLSQEQENRFCVKTYLNKGDILAEDLQSLSKLSRINGIGQIRVGTDQNLYLPHVPGHKLASLEENLHSLQSVSTEPSGVVNKVCPGNDYCELALSSSREAADRIDNFFKDNSHLKELASSLTINVSGCENSCTWYQRADLGVRGEIMKRNGEEYEAYAIHVGQTSSDRPSFSDCIEREVLLCDLPETIGALLEGYEREAKLEETFHDYYRRTSENQ